jgi:alpha-L-fucosidase
MKFRSLSRRDFLSKSALGGIAAGGGLGGIRGTGPACRPFESAPLNDNQKGDQRLSLAELKAWEAWRYGMFIHFGMSTFVGEELPDGKATASTYNPDKLDVDSWIQIARDAGMTYAVLTAKHVAGHCLWPTRYTDYNVKSSGNKTDVVEAFVKACGRHGVRPGFYYCSWDNHNRFGSRTPSDPTGWNGAFTTSVYQTFQTEQLTELLTQYGAIAEMWIDIPGVLGRGYRTFLYEHVARLQPKCVIMMNNGFWDGGKYDVTYAWPSDIVSIERSLPPGAIYEKWKKIESGTYYMPGEICDPIGKNWFYVEGEMSRSDKELAGLWESARAHQVNLLLDVGPDKHGLIPKQFQEALTRLRKSAGLQ